MFIASPVRPTCFPNSELIGPMNMVINFSTVVWRQNVKLSDANALDVRGSESGLKNAAAAMIGSSHLRSVHSFITVVRSKLAIVRPRANKRPKVMSINGHLSSIF
jgi:hypothetical protein